eukprot:scaffold5215_cov181-Amphora_coffeaeformis.AAC.15
METSPLVAFALLLLHVFGKRKPTKRKKAAMVITNSRSDPDRIRLPTTSPLPQHCNGQGGSKTKHSYLVVVETILRRPNGSSFRKQVGEVLHQNQLRRSALRWTTTT